LPFLKRFLTEVAEGIVPSTWWEYEFAGSNRNATVELRNLFEREIPFDTPKPPQLVRRLLQIATSSEETDIVLDFFAGSGTAAQAVLELNHEDERAATAEAYARYRSGSLTERHMEKKYLRTDGSPVWLNITTTLVPGTETAAPFLQSVYMDITERVRFCGQVDDETLLDLYAHAPAVEGGVRPPGDQAGAAVGDLQPVAVPPDAGPRLEVGLAVALPARVVPEAQRHRRHRLGNNGEDRRGVPPDRGRAGQGQKASRRRRPLPRRAQDARRPAGRHLK